jgi:hypothetical protein
MLVQKHVKSVRRFRVFIQLELKFFVEYLSFTKFAHIYGMNATIYCSCTLEE